MKKRMTFLILKTAISIGKLASLDISLPRGANGNVFKGNVPAAGEGGRDVGMFF